MGKFYVVWKGLNPGIYDKWEDVEEQIRGYKGARYKSFPTSAEASIAFREGCDETDINELARLLTGASGKSKKQSDDKPMPWQDNPEIDHNGWAVDASCLGNPGIMEYQGIDLATGKRIFHYGPVKQGTNNIGEFLAIVHAMALAWQRGEVHTIYSDSVNAISWVNRKVVKTQLKETPENAQLFVVMARALAWIRTHHSPCRIVKWDTRRWGEIPADFCRK